MRNVVHNHVSVTRVVVKASPSRSPNYTLEPKEVLEVESSSSSTVPRAPRSTKSENLLKQQQQWQQARTVQEPKARAMGNSHG
jgi:hypothetical protein